MRDEEYYAITLPTGDQAAAQVGPSFGWAQVFVERVTSRVILAVEQSRQATSEALPTRSRPIAPLIVFGPPNRQSC